MSPRVQQIYTLYRAELLDYITKQLGCRDVAGDLCQEVFVRLLRVDREERFKNPRAYMYTIARNLIVDHLRREKRRNTDPVSGYELLNIPDEHPTPERVVSDRKNLSFIREVLLALPERTKHIFYLARVEGLTYREVAARLNISESSVQKHLAKAIEHVMERREDE